MANNILIKQRQQFVRFMRSRGVAFDEIVRMLQEIGNPALLGPTGNEVFGSGLTEMRGRQRRAAKPSR